MMMMMIAIWHYLGQNRPQRRQSPEDGVGRTDRHTYGQIHPCVLQDFVPFGAAAQKEKEKEEEHLFFLNATYFLHKLNRQTDNSYIYHSLSFQFTTPPLPCSFTPFFFSTVFLYSLLQQMSSRLGNTGEFITGRQIYLRDQYLEYRLIKGCFVADGCWLLWKHIFMYSR